MTVAGSDSTFLDDLRRLDLIFADPRWSTRQSFTVARKRARARALTVLETCGPDETGVLTALLAFARELFDALGAELAARPDECIALAHQIGAVLDVPAMTLAREILTAPGLLSLPPAVAVEVLLTLLLAFAPLRNASLWTLDSASRPQCIRQVGDGADSRDARRLARRMLAGEAVEAVAGASLLGVQVERWQQQQPLAVVVARAEPGQRERAVAFVQETVAILLAILERDALLASNADGERVLTETSERRLTRLGFDLHDGPLQDLALIAEDLRLFRDQLGQVLGERPEDRLVQGRVDDLEAELIALETELRRLSRSVQMPLRLSKSFPDALREVVDGFAARAGLQPELSLCGDLGRLSISQQLALLNIAREALSNVREHRGAREVQISVAMRAAGVEARIVDDGKGFDVERTLVSAARGGRLGLAGVHERVRLLGGRCRIESRVGGPTEIAVTIPRWEPLTDDRAGARSRA